MSVNVYINATIPFVIHIVRHLIRSQSLFRLPLIFFETLYVPVIYDFFFCCVDRRKQWLNTDVCQEYIYFTIAASSILFFCFLVMVPCPNIIWAITGKSHSCSNKWLFCVYVRCLHYIDANRLYDVDHVRSMGTILLFVL